MSWLLEAGNKVIDKYGKDFKVGGHTVSNGYVSVETQFYKQFFTKLGFKVIPSTKVLKEKEIKKILIIRMGGIGDLIMALPVIQVLKKEHPKAIIELLAPTELYPIIEHHPDIENMVSWYPQYIGLMTDTYDAAYDFSTIIPSNIEAEYKNAYDLHFEWVGLNSKTDYEAPKLYFTDADREALWDAMKEQGYLNEGEEFIICSFNASSIIRDYPSDKARIVVNTLAERYPEKKIFITGTPAQILTYKTNLRYTCEKCNKDNVLALEKPPKEPLQHPHTCEQCGNRSFILPFNMLHPDDGKSYINWFDIPENVAFPPCSIKEFCMLVEEAKLVISVDSAPVHIAGVFSTPTIGIYSSFVAKNRLEHFPNADWIQGDYICAPCFQHSLTCANRNRQGSIYSPCMDSIDPQRIITKAIEKLEGLSPVTTIRSPGESSCGVGSITPPNGTMCPICGTSNTSHDVTARKGYFWYTECKHCNSLYVWPNPPQDYLKAGYNQEEYNMVFKSTTNNVAECARMLARKFSEKYPTGTSLLEIGCNCGYFLNEVQKEGWECYGVDVSKDSVDECKKLGLTAYQGAITEKSFREILFKGRPLLDAIVLHQTLEHFNNPIEVLSILKPYLAPNGVMSITMPNADRFTGDTDWGHLNGTFPGEHQVLFTVKAIHIMAEKLNMKVDYLELMDSSHDVWVILKKEK